jgi:hypothetical protein
METDGRSFQVRIAHPEKTNGIPRLPHEHDESDDSQQSGPRPDMLQAYTDIMSGQEDTDCREQRSLEPVVKSLLKAEQDKINKDTGSHPASA